MPRVEHEAVSAPPAASPAISTANDDFGSQAAASSRPPTVSGDPAPFFSRTPCAAPRLPMSHELLATSERAEGTSPRVTKGVNVTGAPVSGSAPYPCRSEKRTGSVPQHPHRRHSTQQEVEQEHVQPEPPLPEPQPRLPAPSGIPVIGSSFPELPFPFPPLPTPLPVSAVAACGVQSQRCCSCPLRTWLRRTFPPIVLVGGTAAAKREVAALTGLTLASLFQPFNGEALAARLVAAAAAAPEHRKRQELDRLTAQQKQQHGEQLPPQQPEQEHGPLPWGAERSEDEFLSREGYHPSHVYRYGLLNAGSNSSKPGAAGPSPGPFAVQQGSRPTIPPHYIRDIPPLNLLLHVPASGSTRCSGAAPDAVSAGPSANAPSGSSSSSVSSSSSTVTSLSSSSGGVSDAGDGAGFLPSAAAPGSAESAPALLNSSPRFAASTTSHSSSRGSSDYFCVRFIDLEDAEAPSPLAADALAMRALTQAPPPLQDLSTFTAAAASSAGTPSSSATAPPQHSSVSTTYLPTSRRAPRSTEGSEGDSAGSAAVLARHGAPTAGGAPSIAEVRRSGVRSSASSPFVFPAEGSVGAGEAACSCQPLAGATGCRGTDLLWYEEWERVLFESLRFSEHETLSQPVGLVLVASSRDPDPAQELQQLLQPQRLPSLCNRFILDPNPVRAFVLLDIHPNALQARAELTSACLLRRRRSSTQQLLHTGQQQQQPSGQQMQQQRLQQQPQNAGHEGRAAFPLQSAHQMHGNSGRYSGELDNAAEGATQHGSRSAQSQTNNSESLGSRTTSADVECGQEVGGGTALVAQWHQQQHGSSKGMQQADPAKPGHSAAGENPCLPRGEVLLEQLCAAFPPAHCHLLTLGRATGSPAHWQLLPAIRFLYAQSLTPNFRSTLSAGRTPVMLTGSQSVAVPQVSPHTSPPPFLPLRQSIDKGSSTNSGGRSGDSGDRSEDVAAAAGAGDAAKNAEEEAAAAAVAATAEGVVVAANVDWLLCSGYQLPVASRLTLPPALCAVGGGSSPAQPQARNAQTRGAAVGDPAATAAAALSSIENSFCVGLSWADLHALSAFVQHLVHTGILPWVERKTQQLETAISSSRRGFRNQLRYLWRKPKASAATASASSPAGGTAAAGVGGSSNAATPRTGRSGGVVASAAEQATGAAEAILSVVGGALLGDAASSLYSSASLLHLGGGSSKSQQQQPAKSSWSGPAGSVSAEKSQTSGELNVLKLRGTTPAAKTTGGTGPATGVAAPAAPPPTAYQLHTVEWQYRLQADLYFFMGNFEAALQSFRCCSADFKQDKRWMQLGGAYEMQALCLYLTGGSRRDIDVCIEHGYNAFVKAAAGRLALRCVLLGLRITMEMVAAALPLPLPWNPLSPLLSLRQRVQQLPPTAAAAAAAAEWAAFEAARQLLAANVDLPPLDTQAGETTLTPSSSQQDVAGAAGVSVDADVCKGGTTCPPVHSAAGAPSSGAAAAGQDPVQQHQAAAVAFRAQSWAIRSAMLLEQASLCYEQAGLAHRRKRNFQLVMAGHTYYKAGYKRLALRCYTAVVSQYEWCGWQHVAQHLRFIMARQAFSLHLLLDAVFHFAALLDAVACVHHIRRLVCGTLFSMSQKRAALQDDNSSCVSSVSSSSSTWSSSAPSLPFLYPAATPGYHTTRAATTETTTGGTATLGASQEINGVVSSNAVPSASLGLPEVSAEREAHYVREFVFVCRVILERQKQQLEQQQQHAARALRRGVTTGTEKEQQPYDRVLDNSAGGTSSAGGLGTASPVRGEATSTARTAAAPTGQTTAAATVGGDAGRSNHPGAASAARSGSLLGNKACSAGAPPATPTLTLPVGLRVPYVECCNKQGVFRDAIEVRLQGDAAISSEEWWPRNDSHNCSAFLPESAPTESAAGFASRDKEVWAPEEMLRLLEATTRSTGAVLPLPVAGLCELAQCLLPQQQGASTGGTKLLFAEQQELQLQERFLNEASEAWVETQLEATLRRLSCAAVPGGENAPSAEEDTGEYQQGTPQGPRGILETGELSAGQVATTSDVDAQTASVSRRAKDDDLWLLNQLRVERSRTRGAPGDTREGRGSTTRSCSAIYEELTRRMPVGSPVHVLVCLVNPLQLPLDCRNVRLVGSIQANVPSAAGAPAAASSAPADGRIAGGISASRGAPQQHRQQRRVKKLIEFPAIPTVMLGPLETVCLRLVAVPLVQGKLRIKGLSLDLFGFIRLTQPFCLHGSLRQERQYNLRHCRLFSEDAVGFARGLNDSAKGAPDGERQEFSSCANSDLAGDAGEGLKHHPLPSPSDSGSGQRQAHGLLHTDSRSCPQWESEEQGPEGGLPLSFVVRAESYKLLPTGLPVEALRWRFRQRALEIHREDCRLQLLVDEKLPLLSFSFLGWPESGMLSKPLHQQQSGFRSWAVPSSADDAPPVVRVTQAGQEWAVPASGRQGAVAVQSDSSLRVEQREVPSSKSAPPSLYEPLLSSDAAATPTSDSAPLASSPSAVDAAAAAARATRPCRAAGDAGRRSVSTWPRREHLFVGERSTSVLQVSLAPRSQPLQALSLAVSPAAVVRFQSAVLLLPRDQLQQAHAVRRSNTCSERRSHAGYGEELIGGISERYTEAASTATTAAAGDARLLAKIADGNQQRDEIQLMPLVLQDENPTSGTEKGGQQSLPAKNTRPSPAGPGPGAVAAAHTSRNEGRYMEARSGQRRDGPHRVGNDCAAPEVGGAGVHVVHVLRRAAAGAPAPGTGVASTYGAGVTDDAGNREKCEELMAAGSTVQVQLVLYALQPGIHRVRFCVKAVAAATEDAAAAKEASHHQQQQKKGLSRRCRSSTLWRGIEKVLVVRASLQLTVEPRLSWRQPNRHLLLCRVKNLSSATFCIEQLAAFLPCWSNGSANQSEEATAVATCDVCGQRGSPRPAETAGAECPWCSSEAFTASLQQHAERAGARRPQGDQQTSCEVKVVTLLPCSRRQQDPMIGPHETLHLLYAAKQHGQQRRERMPDLEGSQKKDQLQEALGISKPRHPVEATVEEGSRTTRSAVAVEETSDAQSPCATSEAEDILESALSAGTRIQVGLCWRLAVHLAAAAEAGEESRSEWQQHQETSGLASTEKRLSAAKVSLPARASSHLTQDPSLRAIPRGLVLASWPVELSPRLSYIPLRMQVIVCPPALYPQQQGLKFTEDYRAETPAAHTAVSTHASETDALLARLRQLSPVHSGSFHLDSCSVRRVRFLLQNTSSSLLLRLQLLADLEAAAHALPLRLSAGAAGSATFRSSSWDSQHSCWMASNMSTEGTSLSSSKGALARSAVCSAGGEARLQWPSEDAAANKLIAPYRTSDGGSTSSVVITAGAAAAGNSSMSSPGRFAAALIHRLPLAPGPAAPTSASSVGGVGGAGGSSATTTGGASGAGAVGVGAPLLQFLAPPFPTPQVRATAEALYQQPAAECPSSAASSMSAELQQQHQQELLSGSQLSATVGSSLHSAGCSAEEAAAQALLRQMKRQPQCCALPTVGSSVARSPDAVGSPAASVQPDETTPGARLNDTVDGADQSRQLQPSTAASTNVYSAVGFNPSLDVRDAVEEQQLQPLGVEVFEAGGIVPEILDLSCSSSSFGTGSTTRMPSVPGGTTQRTQDHARRRVHTNSNSAAVYSPSSEIHDIEVSREEASHTVPVRDEGSSHPGGDRGCCNGFYWIGKPEQQLGYVGPGQKVEASLLAFFPSFGVFNVNKVYVRVGVAGQVPSDSSSSSSRGTTTSPAATYRNKEDPLLQLQPETEKRCRGGTAEGSSVRTEASPSSAAAWNASQTCNSRGTDGCQEKRFVVSESFFCSKLTKAELQWEAKLARTGCETVVGFPMECPVYIQPVANGGGAR